MVELASACAILPTPFVVLDMAAAAETGEPWFKLDIADASSFSLSSEICRSIDCIPEAEGMPPPPPGGDVGSELGTAAEAEPEADASWC